MGQPTVKPVAADNCIRLLARLRYALIQSLCVLQGPCLLLHYDDHRSPLSRAQSSPSVQELSMSHLHRAAPLLAAAGFRIPQLCSYNAYVVQNCPPPLRIKDDVGFG